jgi:putative NIF3 family GTP cyclohydrolase 1 type 2
MLGILPAALAEADFLQLVKNNLQAGCVRYTPLRGRPVRKVAVCGGSGRFLLPAARRAGADAFVTADFKYHEFFDAEGDLIIADVGHFESEQFTIELLYEIIREKFPNFALHCTEVNTNPVNYLL